MTFEEFYLKIPAYSLISILIVFMINYFRNFRINGLKWIIRFFGFYNYKVDGEIANLLVYYLDDRHRFLNFYYDGFKNFILFLIREKYYISAKEIFLDYLDNPRYSNGNPRYHDKYNEIAKEMLFEIWSDASVAKNNNNPGHKSYDAEDLLLTIINKYYYEEDAGVLNNLLNDGLSKKLGVDKHDLNPLVLLVQNYALTNNIMENVICHFECMEFDPKLLQELVIHQSEYLEKTCHITEIREIYRNFVDKWKIRSVSFNKLFWQKIGLKSLKVLLEMGLDPSLELIDCDEEGDNIGYYLLFTNENDATSNAYVAINMLGKIKLILSKIPMNKTNSKGYTPLMNAMIINKEDYHVNMCGINEKIIEEMIRLEANPYYRTFNGMTIYDLYEDINDSKENESEKIHYKYIKTLIEEINSKLYMERIKKAKNKIDSEIKEINVNESTKSKNQEFSINF
tara:strand:- start:7891 stop:9252 length:1362 start_codon:yes stop_codon:yes gene_type:complete